MATTGPWLRHDIDKQRKNLAEARALKYSTLEVTVTVKYTPHGSDDGAKRIAGYLQQIVEEANESTKYEEDRGILDPEDRAFTIVDVSAS